MKYLTKQDILAIHVVVIDMYKGTPGILNEVHIDSVLGTVKQGFYTTVEEAAAALVWLLCMSHPFVDGNKRTAAVACDMFLDFNGVKLTAECDDFFDKIHEAIDYDTDDIGLNKDWICANSE